MLLVPHSILMYGNTSDTFSQVLVIIANIAKNTGFGMYLFPSLFLALDRVLVVLFPLTFRKYFGDIFPNTMVNRMP